MVTMYLTPSRLFNAHLHEVRLNTVMFIEDTIGTSSDQSRLLSLDQRHGVVIAKVSKVSQGNLLGCNI